MQSTRRIMVMGSGGAGKSTFARTLGEITGLPVIHLDAHYWQPGWVEPPKNQWRYEVNRLSLGERWIIDGNYGGTMALRMARADLLIFLDYPRWLCAYRALKRWLTHLGTTRPDMGAGCPEKMDFEFFEWIWNFPEEGRVRLLNAVAKHDAGKRLVRLRSPVETDEFLRRLGSRASDTERMNYGR